jgi:hypothetical protein
VIDTLSKFFSQNDIQGSIFIENGAVRFAKEAQWLSGTFIKLGQVKLYSVGSYENQQHDVVFHNNKIMMTGCLLHYLSVSGNKSHLRASLTRWIGNEIQYWVKGSLTLSESDMMGVGWQCDNVGLPFSFRSITFSGNGNPFGLDVQAEADFPLVVEECDFSDYAVGIMQSGGLLKMSCSQFSQLSDGMVLLNGTSLIMNDGAGNNAFDDNDRHIVFNEVTAPGFSNGGNWFGTANQYAIYGLLQVSDTDTFLDWSGNDWSGSSVYVESYLQSEPNDLFVNAIDFSPMQTFLRCHSSDGDVKLRPLALIAEDSLNEFEGTQRYTVYDAKGQLLVYNWDEFEFKKWLAQDRVVAGLYVVLVQTTGKTQIKKWLIP